MSFPDLSFIETARALEIEAIEGGRALSEFSLDPDIPATPEDARVLGRPVDDAEEVSERVRALEEYISLARVAFQQRGLIYPFAPSAAGDSLDILPGHKDRARQVAELSRIVSLSHPVSKEFERRAFKALQSLVGGWGVCVGAPRDDGRGPQEGIKRFRSLLEVWETGTDWPASYASSGDNGADGFVVLGRGWGGPVVFFQSKNCSFSLKNFPEEFARMSEVFVDWFGKRVDHGRTIIPVCAMNTVLTVQIKERIAEARGPFRGHMIDAVDILGTEVSGIDDALRRPVCTIL